MLEIESRLYKFFNAKNNPSKILRFLGSSDSAGIPVNNCLCNACQEYRQKGLKNLATCGYIPIKPNEYILIDCGIEESANLFDGAKIRAVFITHFHADHVIGLLRLRYSNSPIVCFCPPDKEGFADLFKHSKSLEFRSLNPFMSIKIDEFIFTPIPLKHSKLTYGYFLQTPCENIAYLSDCAGVSLESLEFLKKQRIDVAFLDAGACKLGDKKDTNNHLDCFEASEILRSICPKEARLFHASHKILAQKNNLHTSVEYLL